MCRGGPVPTRPGVRQYSKDRCECVLLLLAVCAVIKRVELRKTYAQ